MQTPSLITTPKTEPELNPDGTPKVAETNPDGTPKVEPKVEEKKPDEVVPLKVEDIKLPDGFEARPEALAEFVGILNDASLTPQARVDALVNLQAKEVQALTEQFAQKWVDTQVEWQTEVRNDPELGGQKLDANLGEISKLVTAYGTPKLKEIFDSTGAGNNIEMVRFLTKIAKVVNEGKPVTGAPTNTPMTTAQKMFPSMKS